MSIQKEENEQKELKKMNDSRFTFKNQITEKEKVEKNHVL